MSWIPGSDIERALDEISAAERAVDVAKKTLSQAKEGLAEAVRD